MAQPSHGKRGASRSPNNAGKSGVRPKLGPCPDDISKDKLQAISAPYNFVPLANWVHLPTWGAQATHDWPFQDGVSGEIHYSLHADSPLLVGGKQIKATERNPGEVKPYRLPDGRYAIPGSSIKGMLRAVLEIAGFGRMRMVDEQRPALRDITGDYVAHSYVNRIRGKVNTGFLKQQHGKLILVPCSMVRLNHRDVEAALGITKPIFTKGMSVSKKYGQWQTACKLPDSTKLKFDPGTPDATNLLKGSQTGMPVFTGQISDSTTAKGKKRDFVFYAEREDEADEVSDVEWRDFLRTHGDENGKPDMPWPGYWKRQFRQGHKVPVFYVENAGHRHIGLAYMLKLAGDFSTLDMIGHASPAHLTPSGMEHGYDLADLLFGAIGANQNDALRGRSSCENAVLQERCKPEPQPDTILNGPKPTYFPNYVTQATDSSGLKLRLVKGQGQYATYITTTESRSPTLRGFKRYPARPPEQTHVQTLTHEQAGNKKIQVTLHTLPAHSRFCGRMVFHNLKPEELGALLWVMSLDGKANLRHGLGMGKPFGFGQSHFEIDAAKSYTIPNDPDQQRSTLATDEQQRYQDLFEKHMEQAAHDLGGWRATPQIANLLAMADPEAANDLPAGMKLQHMRLIRCMAGGKPQNLNEFVWAKQNPPGPFVLADYALATGRFTSQGGLPPTHSSPNNATIKHPWLRQQVSRIQSENKIPNEADAVGGKPLAVAWAGIDDQGLKAAVLAEVTDYWKSRNWWDQPPGKAKRKAKDIYTS